MARPSMSEQRGALADLAEIVAYGLALTYGAELWLHGLHYVAGLPQDWGHMLSEATVRLPLVLMALWLIRAGLRSLVSRRGAALSRRGAGALVAVAMALGACAALLLDGLTTQLFYPELALTGSNPFLCTVLSVGVEAAAAIPGLGTAYDALVTLPAMLAIAAVLAALRPGGPSAWPAA